MTSSPAPLPVHCLAPDQLQQAPLSVPQMNWLLDNGFLGQAGRLLALPDAQGGIAGFAFGLGEAQGRPPLILGSAAAALSPGTYRLEFPSEPDPLASLAFRLGAYRFDRYRAAGRETVELAGSADDEPATARLVEGAFLARDLINTPANDLGPQEFETRIRSIAENLGMDCKVIAGDDLLA
ncbi:MAG TPA: leucyl aminopeptidase family protein, partial [Devosia sp.]|nr:leucyl aminopeptidase family protein [Devosia sp.]